MSGPFFACDMQNWFKMFLLFLMLGLLVYFNSLNNKFLIDDYVFKQPYPEQHKIHFIPMEPLSTASMGVLDTGMRIIVPCTIWCMIFVMLFLRVIFGSIIF